VIQQGEVVEAQSDIRMLGALYERSKIPLHKWLAATHLMMASKKGMSALQIGRLLGLSKKTAWFVCHRIRESLRDSKFDEPLGGKNKIVEADETYVGGKARYRKGRIPPKEAVFALVEREGKVRSFHVQAVSAKTLRRILFTTASRESYLMTDEATTYTSTGRGFTGHGTSTIPSRNTCAAAFGTQIPSKTISRF